MRITLLMIRQASFWLAGLAVACLVPGSTLADGATTERSQLSALLSADDDAGFALATEPRRFEFPRDHGPHPEFRNEWWYVTGNLDAADGRRVGFELTIFRFALTPTSVDSASAWHGNQVYIAHFAVSDADGDTFHVAERYSRGALGLAGAVADPFRVWIDDWRIAAVENEAGREYWLLEASDDEVALQLRLVANKAPVLNGAEGLSQKSARIGNASYYYSITRWQTDGLLRLGDDEIRVSGLSWLDREWSSSALDAHQEGWDWFALQLSDGSELMFYNLRSTDGTQGTYSSGTWVASDGTSEHLDRGDVSISVTEEWISPKGGTYPSGWDIRIPDLALTLNVSPVMEDQELDTTVRYWEGAVDVLGVRDGRDISGRGYVELTGYAD